MRQINGPEQPTEDNGAAVKDNVTGEDVPIVDVGAMGQDNSTSDDNPVFDSGNRVVRKRRRPPVKSIEILKNYV
jgi:hypothetical protein